MYVVYSTDQKVTHAMKRASHVGCNACNARIQRVLHRICYTRMLRIWSAYYIAFATRMSRIWSAPHLYNIRVTFAQHSHNNSHNICVTFAHHNCICHALHDVFVARVSSIHVLQMSRTSSVGPWVAFGQYYACT
jgi:hypothetical protein